MFFFNSTGTAGCPCVDASGVLASLVSRSCETSDGRSGAMLTAEGPCVPRSYGSGCGRHDLLHDPRCALAEFGEAGTPDYCLRSWCFVDAEVCKRSPSDRLYRSYYFPQDEGIDLFYSYSTCNSTADDWLSYEEQIEQKSLGGISISAVIPDYMPPLIYKRNATGDILETTGSEYYNSSVPFEGALIDYVNNLVGISEGDFSINFTYGSEPGKAASGGSRWMGAVQDVADGLADMAAGPFWITGERLEMVSFTVPLFQDKTVLFIPKPGEDSVKAQTQKVLAPFTMGLWGLAIALIAVTAVISVWFSRYGKRITQHKHTDRVRKMAYARLVLDEFLHKGISFCSGGVEQDAGASLPQKLLMAGFGFFILILVSAYVANLAAFLTRPDEYIGTMEDVVSRNVRVCASPIFKTSLEILWPTVHFIYVYGAPSKMIAEYQAGKCQVLAAGKFDVTHSVRYMKAFCDAGLVYTDSLVIENPIAFPIRSELAAGLSYWIYHGEKKRGVTLEAAEKEYDEKYKRQPMCDLEFSVYDYESSELDPIKPKHLFFPIMFFLGFAALASILQLYHQWTLSRAPASRGRPARATVIGRTSHFDNAVRRESSFGRLRKYFSSVRFSGMDLGEDARDADGAPEGRSTPGGCDAVIAVAKDAKGSARKSAMPALDVAREGDGVRREDDCFDNDNPPEQSVVGTSVQKRTRFVCDEDGAPAQATGEGAGSVRNDAATRLQLLVETGAFDEILDCVKEIKKQ